MKYLLAGLLTLAVFALFGCAAKPTAPLLTGTSISVAPEMSSLMVCPTKETLCPDIVEKKAVKPTPEIEFSFSVRYCDKPVVVWAQLKGGGKMARFDAEETPSKDEFPTIEDFVKWLDSAPSDVYDLPCVGEKNVKPFDEGSSPGGQDKGVPK